ncbi:MAG TPA: protein translocase subunit SecD [Vicinamibacterales bacterium]|nr:protein translocase subunit SecD [Vicinamibacterales bacterium]
MSFRLRWKAVLVAAVILASAVVTWYPPAGGLTLGLDLRGGVQFVLRANVDEVLRADGGGSRDEIVEQARQAIDRRTNELGVVEPLILVQGDNRDEILVQLPGFTDVARAREVLGTTAKLEWKLVEAGTEPERERLLDSGISGRDIRNASVTVDDQGLPAVGFTLTPDGGRRFAELTAANRGRQLAIVLDGRIRSAPVIEDAITGGTGVIRGGFTAREASDLAIVLRSGALPVSLTYLGGQYVGPTLGLQSVHAGLGASLAGLVFVGIFMLVYYNRAGINAVLSIVANLTILLGAMAVAGAALTLPGIAGLILTIGMGVDSNVLIFERIKEELAAGKPRRAAITAGFGRVFLTILDTHVASLIAAALLFQFGSGPVRGFATTLTLGLLTNVFTAVVVSRTLFEVTLSMSPRARLTFSTFSTGAHAVRTRLVDFMRWRRVAFVTSAALVAIGLTTLISRGGLPLGLDFSGGTAIVARFDAPVSEDAVRQALSGEETVQRYGPVENQELLIRLPHVTASAGGVDSAPAVRAVSTALASAGLPRFEVGGSETVGAALGADFRRKAATATALSIAGITAYIAFRFRPSFAAGAIVATVHDIAVTVSMLSLCGYDLTLNTVAAILTIAGYSVNDTIVIFDRVRENLKTMGKISLTDAVNLAVNQTLGRTIITAGTTFLSVLALFIWGGDVLNGFAFAMLVGIVAGTYSTIFIAAPIAAMLGRRGR